MEQGLYANARAAPRQRAAHRPPFTSASAVPPASAARDRGRHASVVLRDAAKIFALRNTGRTLTHDYNWMARFAGLAATGWADGVPSREAFRLGRSKECRMSSGCGVAGTAVALLGGTIGPTRAKPARCAVARSASTTAFARVLSSSASKHVLSSDSLWLRGHDA